MVEIVMVKNASNVDIQTFLSDSPSADYTKDFTVQFCVRTNDNYLSEYCVDPDLTLSYNDLNTGYNWRYITTVRQKKNKFITGMLCFMCAIKSLLSKDKLLFWEYLNGNNYYELYVDGIRTY